MEEIVRKFSIVVVHFGAGNQQDLENVDPRQYRLWSDIRAEARLDAVRWRSLCTLNSIILQL